MTRTFILINTNSEKTGYPRVYYCNGCNLVGETILSMFEGHSRTAREKYTLADFESFLLSARMEEQKNATIKWLWEADEFYIFHFDQNDENPSIRLMKDL